MFVSVKERWSWPSHRVCVCVWVKERWSQPSPHVGGSLVHTHTHTHRHTVKERSSLVEWGCKQEHTTQETVASIKNKLEIIYNGVLKKKKHTNTN